MALNEKKAREARARRAVAKAGDGFVLTKGRGRGYMIVHHEFKAVVLDSNRHDGWGLTIEEVEEFAGIAPPSEGNHRGTKAV
ncbi:Uncharacterised protein [Starkeya nomas]|uniref:Uncharacterized protein n=1 Tax=Starkeya nomas TaxID=2666134 RepID=A0A5S9NZP5_9HYPH|nr:hypothetical protein [Starkeya nomas]CAA0096371.1 Uncharacterised protein [Starkeya nomas]